MRAKLTIITVIFYYSITVNRYYVRRLSLLLSATVFSAKSRSKMALRTVCVASLRTGTDLGVNNARTFVTTGIVTISHLWYRVDDTFTNYVPELHVRVCRAISWSGPSLNAAVEDILPNSQKNVNLVTLREEGNVSWYERRGEAHRVVTAILSVHISHVSYRYQSLPSHISYHYPT